MSHRWSRIELGNVETRTFDDEGETALDLRPGLQARVADPLWLLSRQRQVGEFKGEDAASPIEVRLTGDRAALTHWGHAGAPDQPLGSTPLETLVEQTPVFDGPGRFGLAVDLASQLQRRLHDAGIALDLRDSYPLAVPDAPLQGRRQAWYALMARRSFDALHLHEDVEEGGADNVASTLSSDPGLPEVLDAWADQVADFARQPTNPEAWLPERLEHALELSVDTPAVTARLSCAEYPGGRLDWWAFDLTAVQVEPDADLDHIDVVLLPTPLTYAGMPAIRWWEMEDRRVHFGDIDAGPEDLARLIVAEFATTGADDWYVIPVPLAHGQLARITALTVTDAFGRQHDIEPAVQVDQHLPERPWRFFELGPDGPTWMLLAPAVASILEGPTVEDVWLWRDEDANLVWAEERVVEGADGRPVPRDALWQAHARRSTATPEDPDSWAYHLETEVPPHWIPFVPTDPAVAPGELRRGRMTAWERSQATLHPGAHGALLAGAAPRVLEEQEVPIEGIRITRRWQACRDADGRVHLWLGRAKRAGRGVAPSGLLHDQITGVEDEPN